MESSARVAHITRRWEQRQIMRHVGGGSDSAVTPVTESPDSRHAERGFCFQMCKISFFVQLSVKHISFCIFRVYDLSFVRLGCDVTMAPLEGRPATDRRPREQFQSLLLLILGLLI